MSPLELVSSLTAKGVILTPEGANLRIRHGGTLSLLERDALRAHKADVLALLTAPDVWTRARATLSPFLERGPFPLYLGCFWDGFLVYLRKIDAPSADPIGEAHAALVARPHLADPRDVNLLTVSRGASEELGRCEGPLERVPQMCGRCRFWTPTLHGLGECAQNWQETAAFLLCDLPDKGRKGIAFRSRDGEQV